MSVLMGYEHVQHSSLKAHLLPPYQHGITMLVISERDSPRKKNAGIRWDSNPRPSDY